MARPGRTPSAPGENLAPVSFCLLPATATAVAQMANLRAAQLQETRADPKARFTVSEFYREAVEQHLNRERRRLGLPTLEFSPPTRK